MKNNIKSSIVIILLISVLFFSFSCKSTSFPILGQNKIFQDNLYKEYMNLGNSYYKIEKYSEAITFYNKVLDDKSLGKAAYYKIAQCYGHMADWKNALPMYEKLLEEDPDNQTIKSNIAYIYAMTGDVENCISMYSELLEVQPDNLTYLENFLAVILSDKDVFIKNQEQFKTLFESLKENYPKNKNIEPFQKKYEEYTEKKEEDGDNSSTESESKSKSENGNERTN